MIAALKAEARAIPSTLQKFCWWKWCIFHKVLLLNLQTARCVCKNAYKKCLYCHHVPSCKSKSSFLQVKRICAKPVAGGHDGMKVTLWCSWWYPSSCQVAEDASCPALPGPLPQAGSLEHRYNHPSWPFSLSSGVNFHTKFAYVKCHQVTI